MRRLFSIRGRVCPFVRRSLCPVSFSKVKNTHTRRILCRVSGLVCRDRLLCRDFPMSIIVYFLFFVSFQNHTLEGKDLVFTLTPAQHWCVRSGFDKNQVLWGSWAICSKNVKTWFGGDTGYCKCSLLLTAG